MGTRGIVNSKKFDIQVQNWSDEYSIVVTDITSKLLGRGCKKATFVFDSEENALAFAGVLRHQFEKKQVKNEAND